MKSAAVEDEYRRMARRGPINIGNDVWIGYGAVILRGVSIGDGAIVGAGAVVTKDVDPYTIVGGVPAKTIRKRFNEKIIRQLLKIKWWDWSEKKMIRNKSFFNMNLNEFTGSITELIKE